MNPAQQWLRLLQQLPLHTPLRVMNVCGGHERTISQSGLRSLLPAGIELIPGPGCPVCICPEEDIYTAIRYSLEQEVTLLAYGDMLRVVVNAPQGTPRSLEQARSIGADVRPIASPLDAVAIASSQPRKKTVFLAAGFETTTAPLAAQIIQGLPDNLLLLMAARLTWPAVAMLLDSGDAGFDALIAPGHVAAVMGASEWEFVCRDHHLPVAVSGFKTENLLEALYGVVRQHLGGQAELQNSYSEVVREKGNQAAQSMLNEVFEVTEANWRGIGIIPASGLNLRQPWGKHDARNQLPDYRDEARRRAGEMPPGCACSEVVMGKRYPDGCPLYGTACTPYRPVGPCMVSDEGACRIWWDHGK